MTEDNDLPPNGQPIEDPSPPIPPVIPSAAESPAVKTRVVVGQVMSSASNSEPASPEVLTRPADGPAPEDGALVASDVQVEGDLYEGLDDRQIKGVLALLSEPTIARAATIVGIHERTLRRWLNQEVFKRVYHTARREAFGHAVGLTQRYAPVAVNTLVKVMTDPHVQAGVKVAAASTLLRFGRAGIELDDLAERIEQLELAQQQSLQGVSQ